MTVFTLTKSPRDRRRAKRMRLEHLARRRARIDAQRKRVLAEAEVRYQRAQQQLNEELAEIWGYTQRPWWKQFWKKSE